MSDLAHLIRKACGQEDIYAIHLELSSSRKAATTLERKAEINRLAQSFYLAMDGSTARRTFPEPRSVVRRGII